MTRIIKAVTAIVCNYRTQILPIFTMTDPELHKLRGAQTSISCKRDSPYPAGLDVAQARNGVGRAFCRGTSILSCYHSETEKRWPRATTRALSVLLSALLSV